MEKDVPYIVYEGNEAAYDVRMLLNRTHDEQTRQELSKLLDKLESM